MNKYTETLQTTKRLQGWSQKASIIVLNKLLIEKRGHAACMCMCMTCMWTRKHTSRRFGFSNDKVFWVKNTHPSQSTLCSRDGKSGENETKEERGVKERKYTKLQVEIIKVTLKFRSSLRRRGQMVFRGPGEWNACGLTFTEQRKGCSTDGQILWGFFKFHSSHDPSRFIRSGVPSHFKCSELQHYEHIRADYQLCFMTFPK